MITFRTFINTDPPHVLRIWQGQPALRGRATTFSHSEFEDLILSKPYFDRSGFMVAVDGETPVGFAHAAFGPNADFSSTNNEIGIVCCVLVEHRPDANEIRLKLLQQCEKYLIDRGASSIYAGGNFPYSPFYLGLYGGSRLPGILIDDLSTGELFRSNGYETESVQVILHCDLDRFRPPIDRKQMMVRRKYEIRSTYDPKANTWWDACTLGYTARTRFELLAKADGHRCGEVTFWDMVPLSNGWPTQAAGIYDLQVEPGWRRNGLAMHLVCEAIKELQTQNIKLAEIQTSQDDAPSITLFEKLGFSKVDEGHVLIKRAV